MVPESGTEPGILGTCREKTHQGRFPATVPAEKAQPAAGRKQNIKVGKERFILVAFTDSDSLEELFRLSLVASKSIRTFDRALFLPLTWASSSCSLCASSIRYRALVALAFGPRLQPFGLPPDLIMQTILILGLLRQEFFPFFQKITVTAIDLKGPLRVDR